jgi:DNA-binding CsgD family transcriptional regulator
MGQQEITVSLSGGYPLDQASLTKLIESFPGITVVPNDAALSPDVLIWLATERQTIDLSSIQGSTAVLLLVETPYFESLPENVNGLFSKEESPGALAAAIRQVARGEQYLSPPLALAFLKNKKSQGENMRDSALETLSDREREIFDLLAQGQSNKSIAGLLYLSVRTVEGHLARIYAKLGVHSRTEAMLVALENR